MPPSQDNAEGISSSQQIFSFRSIILSSTIPFTTAPFTIAHVSTTSSTTTSDTSSNSKTSIENQSHPQAQRKQQYEYKQDDSARKLGKYTAIAEKHSEKTGKHFSKARKYSKRAGKSTSAAKLEKYTREASDHVEKAKMHMSNAEEYAKMAQELKLKEKESGEESEVDDATIEYHGYDTEKAYGKKRSREVVAVEDQPPDKKHRKVRDGAPKHFHQEKEKSDELSSKRARHKSPEEKAASTLTPMELPQVNTGGSSLVPSVSRAHHDYIKELAPAKLRSMETELKGCLKEQENPMYSSMFNTSVPEHSKEVTSTLLREIQLELSTQTDNTGPHLSTNPKPRDIKKIWSVPYNLKALYKDYRSRKLDIFTYFSKLPPELRMMIWEKVGDQRIIKIEMIRSYNGRLGRIISRTKPPAHFLVNKESREAALKVYQPLPTPSNPYISIPSPILVNYEFDTLYFHRSCFRNLELFKNNTPIQGPGNAIIKLDKLACALDQVRSLAVDAYFLTQKECPSLGQDLIRCSALKELTVVLGKTYHFRKGELCPILKGFSRISQLSRPPLVNSVKQVGSRTYVCWNIGGDPKEIRSVRGQFRAMCHQEKRRESGAIKCLEIFHRDFQLNSRKYKKQWEQGRWKGEPLMLCKCHAAVHQKIYVDGNITYEAHTSSESLLSV